MYLDYRIAHKEDYSKLLEKTRLMLNMGLKYGRAYAIEYGVKYCGLKKHVAIATVKKYLKENEKISSLESSISVVIPRGDIEVLDNKKIIIKSLGIEILYELRKHKNIAALEICDTFYRVKFLVSEKETIVPKSWIGVDINSTKHVIVAADIGSGKVLKLGKKMPHIITKYNNLLDKTKCKKKIDLLKKRYKNIVTDICHKESHALIEFALKHNAGIVIEDDYILRKCFGGGYILKHQFKKLREYIKYKAKINGIPVVSVNPYMTSKECSRCGKVGRREGKVFHCDNCGNLENADVNAAFVIALRYVRRSQSSSERVGGERSSGALVRFKAAQNVRTSESCT